MMAPGYQNIMLAHLWKRDNGFYYAIWSDNDRTRQKSLKTKDKRKAQARLNNHNRELSAGKIKPIQPRVTSRAEDFRLRYLEHVESEIKKDELRPSSYMLYKVALDKAISAWGKDKNLLRLNKKDIAFYQQFAFDQGLKKVTVNKNYRHLKSALKKGQEWRVVNKDLSFPRQWKTQKEIRYFTKKELQQLIVEITDPEFSDFCLLAAYSGMRSGEIVRLTARDVDNPTGFIRISAQQKNRQEDRIPINKNMRKILKRHNHDIGPLFRFKTVDYVSQLFRKYADNAGFKDRRFHDLRHTYGAHLIMAGVDIRKVQLLMRHRSIESTMVYTRLWPVDLVADSNTLNYGVG